MESTQPIAIPKIEPEKPIEVVSGNVKSKKKIKKIWFIVPTVILIILAVFAIPLILFALQLKSSYTNLIPITSSMDISNTTQINGTISLVKTELVKIEKKYKLVSWMKFMPWMGSYIKDTGHVLQASKLTLEAGEMTLVIIEPYLSVLGFNDSEKTSEITAQERIDFIVNAIPEVIPKTGEILTKINLAEEELSQIDPEKYPVKFKEIEVREKMKKGLDLFNQVSTYASSSKPLLEIAPYLLGIDGERKYFVLFQNDKELRATGGFLTAYSIMKVNDAKFEPVSSNDIYNLDAKYKPVLPVPEAISELIKGPYITSKNIRLRDINYNPDFEESMILFSQEAEKVGIKDIDGIIAVDTQLVVNLLDALGEIGVPGFGNFSTKLEPKCNCPQVIYELESFADTEGPIIWDPLTGKIILTPPNYDNRKKIIGPLMNSVLANALGQPKEKMPALFDAIFKSLMEKHVLFYLFDEDAQKAVADFGIAGKIKDYPEDYLHINDSNLGGRKSNLYVTTEVEQEITKNNQGVIEKTVTLTYKNPEKYDGWLNSVLPNWVRVYVPKGSTLVSTDGLEKEYETYEELGKSVFSGYFSLRPEGVAKIVFKYKLPIQVKESFKMYIQKQPGVNAPLYTITSDKFEEEFYLRTDKEIRVKVE